MKRQAIILIMMALAVNVGYNSRAFAANSQSIGKNSFVNFDTKYSQQQNNQKQHQVAFLCRNRKC